MKHITLEINVKSAHIFKNANYFSKMHLYTIATITTGGPTSSTSSSTTKSTVVDMNGYSNPFWWSKMKFQIDEPNYQNNTSDLSLAFSVMCRRTLCPDIKIGQVNLPVKDLLDYYPSGSTTRGPYGNAAYAVCSPRSGKIRGVLYLSYAFCFGDFDRVIENCISEPTAVIAPTAPYYDELDDDYDSGMKSDQRPCGCDSSRPIPSAPYI